MNESAVSTSTQNGRSIGAILIDSGRLTVAAAEQIIKLQKTEGLRFGDAAVRLGLLTEQDIQQALSNQFDYPYLMPGDERVDTSIVAAFKPFSPVVEQLRILRSQLMLRWFDAENSTRTLAILSPGRGEGRSFIAANLAVVFSQLGERTLLIDADMRNPAQHHLFRQENKAGVSGVLAGLTNISQAIVRINGLKDLSLLPAGATPPNPQELLGRDAFPQLLAQVRSMFDVIVIDTSATDDSADAFAVAGRVGAAAVVARKHFTRSAGLLQTVKTAQQAGAQIIGSILNNG